jgi:DNA-binding IclR family transcriptional regulator
MNSVAARATPANANINTSSNTNIIVSGVQTIDRTVSVIEAVATAGACSLADLVRLTDLARPTAYRLAIACEQQGLLARDADGRFRLGSRLVGWGAQAARMNPLVESARPVLANLVEQTGESAQLYVREGRQRVCVATHERASGLRDTVPLGAVMPLTKGSGGKVLLAWADDRDQFDVAASALEEVRRRGDADSSGEREPGVASVSAPVRGHDGQVLAAISVSGPAERMHAEAMTRHRAAVRAAAAILSR